MLTGHLRADRTRPLFIHLGLILAASICLLAVLPNKSGVFPALVCLGVVSGCGIAIVHPEGLRAVHVLSRIPPPISTGVFMTGGILGFASGGAVSAYFVSRFGLQGLYLFILCPALGILMVGALKIRLAVEPEADDTDPPAPVETRLSFWYIMAMAVPACTSTTIVALLLPTCLNELGFGLTFGGFSTMMFGLGGALGSLIWGYVAHKKGVLLCLTIALFLVLPFLAVYLFLLAHPAALYLLFGVGFCAFSAYILMVTLARHAVGPNLGRRMGLMVGGTWALAILIFWALLPAAEYFGSHFVLSLSLPGYLISAAIGLYIIRKTRRQSPGPISPQATPSSFDA